MQSFVINNKKYRVFWAGHILSEDRKVLLKTTVFCSTKLFFVGSTSVSRGLDPCLQHASLMPWVQSEVLLRYLLAMIGTN